MNGCGAAAADVIPRYEAEIRSLCTEVLDRYEEITLVYRLCERLGSVLGETAISKLVLEEAARTFGARSGEIWFRGEIALLLAAAVPAGRGPGDLGMDEVPRRVVESGRPFLAEPEPGHEAVGAVPIPSADGTAMGALVLRGRPAGRQYRAGDIKLMTALASLASAFIRNGRLAAEVRRAEARKREDEIARQIHQGLLPRAEPAQAGLVVQGGHRAADNVGGDYYGYLTMPDGGLGLAMADVSGHGVGAALYMAAAKGALQAEARRELSPAAVLRRTNDVLAEDFSHSDVFATAVLFRFLPGGSRFVFSNAGHNPPLLARSGGGVERLDQGGTALGVFAGMKYDEKEHAFDPGDVLVVYTDGLVEARDPSRRFFGLDRLIEIVDRERSGGVAHIRESILKAMAAHCGGVPPVDDVTLVVVKRVESGQCQGDSR